MSYTRLTNKFDGKVAQWWRPDDVAFVDALAAGPTGKVMKNLMREQFIEHKLLSA